MPFSDKDQLLAEVLCDANYLAFRRDLEFLALTELRRARPSPFRPWVALAALLVFAALLLEWRNARSVKSVSAQLPQDPPTSVVEEVRSVGLSPLETIRSTMDLGLVVRTEAEPQDIEIVRSSPLDSIPFMNDAELLALFPGESVGLIRRGHASSKTLVFFYDPSW